MAKLPKNYKMVNLYGDFMKSLTRVEELERRLKRLEVSYTSVVRALPEEEEEKPFAFPRFLIELGVRSSVLHRKNLWPGVVKSRNAEGLWLVDYKTGPYAAVRMLPPKGKPSNPQWEKEEDLIFRAETMHSFTAPASVTVKMLAYDMEFERGKPYEIPLSVLRSYEDAVGAVILGV